MNNELYQQAKALQDEIDKLEDVYKKVDTQGLLELRIVTENGSVHRYVPMTKESFLTMVRDNIDLLKDEFEEL